MARKGQSSGVRLSWAALQNELAASWQTTHNDDNHETNQQPEQNRGREAKDTR